MSDVEDSFALAQRYPIVWLHLNNPIPYPGTRLYEIVEDNNWFLIPPEEYLNTVSETDSTPVFATPELPLETREKLLTRCREIEKDVKRRAVRQMFSDHPLLGRIGGRIFASPVGQRLFFQNMAVRAAINWVWYRKMMQV